MNSQKVELIIKFFLLNILVFLAPEIFQLHTVLNISSKRKQRYWFFLFEVNQQNT